MYRREAKEFIVSNPARFLSLDNQSKEHPYRTPGYVCPICGSGTGKHGTGITSKDGIHFTCWSNNCFRNADIIDIIGLKYGLNDYNLKLERACIEYGIVYSSLKSDEEKQVKNERKIIMNKEEVNSIDYNKFFAECAKHRDECDYLDKRGISKKTQEKFGVGYCPNWQSPAALKKGYKPAPTPRIIIPTSTSSYIARDTRTADMLNEQEQKYIKMKEGKSWLFNTNAFKEYNDNVFVVEGEIDAMSIVECGYGAVALGSTSNYRKLVEYVKSNNLQQTIIIALDNDKRGQYTSSNLFDELKNLGVDCFVTNICGEHKDPNEHLIADRDAFQEALKVAIDTSNSAKELKRQDYLKKSNTSYLWQFMGNVGKNADTPCIPTGINELDALLDGGLYEGLYFIGAISSLGKTTFTLQIADNIAKAGNDVLIFSLEMARNELIAKSLSRLTAQLAMEKGQSINNAKSARGITTSKLWQKYSEEEKALIYDAVKVYQEYAGHVFIFEGIGDISVRDIREAVEHHISMTGNVPVVVIDYLQILAPYNERATDKQNTDKAVLELKRISRDYKLAVIGISSFNRDNYNTKVSMQSFKESGAIEYSSDVLIGLQLQGAGESNFDVDAEKSRNPRHIEARILKNRNGKTGTRCSFDYYPQFNYFKDALKPPVMRESI